MKFDNINRRQMMLGAGRLFAGLTLMTGCQPSAETGNKAKHREEGFKVGLCDWDLKKTADPAALEMAKKFGADGVQVSVGGADECVLCTDDIQRKYLNAITEYGVEVPSLCLGGFQKVPFKSDPRADKLVSDSIDACKAMRAGNILLPFFGKGDLRNDPKGVDAVVEKLKNIAPKAEKAGVILGIEDCLSAKQNIDILNRIGSPAVKIYYDTENSYSFGYDIYKEIRMIKGQMCGLHVKNKICLLDQGPIDFRKVREAVDDIGYRGWVYIEANKFPLGFEESIRHNIAYMRKIFPRYL